MQRVIDLHGLCGRSFEGGGQQTLLARNHFQVGNNSEGTPAGSRKRRLIIDLRRSGGNSKAQLKERIVLPRAAGLVETIRTMYGLTMEEQREGWGRELVLIDIQDAFPHLALHPDEIEHCLAPSVTGSGYLVFRAPLFGLKTAPLLGHAMQRGCPGSCNPASHERTHNIRRIWMTVRGCCKGHSTGETWFLHTLAAIGHEGFGVGKGEEGRRHLGRRGVQTHFREGENSSRTWRRD